MNIFVVGSGGREDAFVWKLNGEETVTSIHVCPGHGGMERFDKVTVQGELSDIEIVNYCVEQSIDLVVIGPEAPLTRGLADQLRAADIPSFGPGEKASALEGSKIFSKEFMSRHNIPTAEFKVFDSYQEAVVGLKDWPVESEGVVIKADGLAGGKGVVVTFDRSEAQLTLHNFMVNQEISVKSDRILLERVLPGDEVSVFAMANGLEFKIIGSACDHKRIGDNDTGPNTGGMGCFHDPAWPDSDLLTKIKERILEPTLKGCLEEDMAYNGFLFMGLMVDKNNDPYVVEYNVRFGDPETQTLLPLLEGDLGQAMLAFSKGESSSQLSVKEQASVHVVVASGGYPSLSGEPLDLGHVIVIEDQEKMESLLFLAGVQKDPRNRGFLNTGGRVLGVTARAGTIEEARAQAYRDIERISFKGMYCRKDIGAKKRGNNS